MSESKKLFSLSARYGQYRDRRNLDIVYRDYAILDTFLGDWHLNSSDHFVCTTMTNIQIANLTI